MKEKNNTVPMFTVIYPYKFNDFLYNLLEIEFFKSYCETEVWDVSYIINREFAEKIKADRSHRKEIIEIKSIKQFLMLLVNLRKAAKERRVCVLNEVVVENFSSLICNFMIKVLIRNTGLAVLDVYNGGVQIRTFEEKSAGDRKNYLAKLMAYVKRTETHKEALRMFKGFFCLALARCFNVLPTTHRLVAGDEWIDVARRHGAEKKGVKFVYGSAWDYSNDLLKRIENTGSSGTKQRIAILLDGAGPAFGSDHEHLKRKPALTSDVWYPSLTRFLNKVEKETGVVAEIAGHYKSAHPPIAPCFGNRRVHYGKTGELVRNSEFVITRMSAAVSYAVIYRKPVIYIYSDELKEDRLAMDNIRMMAEALGQEPVNIDEFSGNISTLLVVDESKYMAYEKACLTS
ncbi:MAG: hypothetical protein LUQ37_07710, partial [Methanoregulaceae archaeon]|nr:hypothetical protein [Methanoregulaceae archaeon]